MNAVNPDFNVVTPKGRQGYRACAKCGTLNHVRRAVCDHCQNPFPVKPGKTKAAKPVKASGGKPGRPRKVEIPAVVANPVVTIPDPYTFQVPIDARDNLGPIVPGVKWNGLLGRHTRMYDGQSGLVANPQKIADKVMTYATAVTLPDLYGLELVESDDPAGLVEMAGVMLPD
jgi:hypothetical protein